ncbi:MAG: anchored repeat ABC transporter, substrate-binding protein [Rothia sp. (in: high G+C Gram-positive bacteria)]|nr:anchored repeat ABC transporter, substrate-binding protein [Rothia sp. (in: high G+C Gram-positive bacteria)]
MKPKHLPAYLPLLLAFLLALTGCSGLAERGQQGLQVVASTPILADLASSIAGDRAQVTSLVPAGANPHTYEPSLRDVRQIAYADVAFTNGLLLEQQKVVRMVDANLPQDAISVAVAEEIESYGGKLIPIVEDASLDSIWLGLRTSGAPREAELARDASVTFRATEASGPGQLAAFITGTFGSVEKVADSGEGGHHHSGALGETALPLQAHTHLSWAYTQPGIYSLSLEAQARTTEGNPLPGLRDVPPTPVHFAVGVLPDAQVQAMEEASGKPVTVLDAGHADLTAQLDSGQLVIRTDSDGQVTEYDPATTVIAVPSRTLQELPAGPQYRFLGKPGDQVYLLAQAVLGKHVHGEIDPHIWHSVPNVMSTAQLMRDTLIAADPAGAATYRANTEALLAELEGTDQELHRIYDQLPDAAKNLVTTHDGYRYLASTYGLNIAGYVSPVAGVEPSIQQRERLRRTIDDLAVPALYTERRLMNRTPVLKQVGDEAGVRVCELYSDSLDADAPSYSQMMLTNAQIITDCSATSP